MIGVDLVWGPQFFGPFPCAKVPDDRWLKAATRTVLTMIAFPVLKSLTIERYGLFPPSIEHAFVVTFEPGPNVIAGVNGSGKTTLVDIALRCLTGPYNLPSSTSESELGQVRPRVIPMSRHDRQLFGRRVADGAQEAAAALVAVFGEDTVEIKRQLSDLTLIECAINGQPMDLNSTVEQKKTGG
jgi:hypothetical protein